MTTLYIVMKAYTATVDVPGKDRRRKEPKFWFDTEAEAVALSGRLNRSMITWYSLVNLPPERQGPDHQFQLANAEAAAKAADDEAVDDAKYSVESVGQYAGPNDNVMPAIVALMTAMGQLPNPPTNVFAALFRLIRDASPPPPPPPEPEPGP
jgi:hypothetical protein